MLKTILRLCRCERGAALVEFTLVLPILILLTAGVVQFGYIFFVQNTMQNMAREAARGIAVGELSATGSDTTCPGGVAGSAEEHVCDGLSGLNGTFTVNAVDPPDPGDDVVVSVSLPMEDATVMDPFNMMGNGNITTEATMRKE